MNRLQPSGPAHRETQGEKDREKGEKTGNKGQRSEIKGRERKNVKG